MSIIKRRNRVIALSDISLDSRNVLHNIELDITLDGFGILNTVAKTSICFR